MDIRNLLSPMSIEPFHTSTPRQHSPPAEESEYLDIGNGCGVLVLPTYRQAAISAISIFLDDADSEAQLRDIKLLKKLRKRKSKQKPKSTKHARDGANTINRAPMTREYTFVICIPSIQAGKTFTAGLVWEERRDDGIAPTTSIHRKLQYRRDDRREERLRKLHVSDLAPMSNLHQAISHRMQKSASGGV